MDILIKGMEMPKSCEECALYDEDYCECRRETNFLERTMTRENGCPLVALPEHGRLIDADDFIYNFEDIINESRRVLSEKGEDIRVLNNFHDTVSELVGLMPTIVEAST